MPPTLAPDGTVIDDGSQPFVGSPLGPVIADPTAASRPAPSLANVPAPPDQTATAAPQTAPDVMPKFLFDYARRSTPFAKAPAIAATSPEQQAQVQPQGYWQTSTDPNTGMPSIANPNLSKLGKVLTILRAAGMGFAAGAGQPNMSRAFLGATQYWNQQAAANQQQQQNALTMENERQMQPLNLQIARQKVAMLPLEQQKAELEVQNQQLALRGLHTVYHQENDGSFSEQVYDRNGDPVGKPISHTISPQAMAYAYRPHLQLVPRQDGTYANWNRLTGKFEDLNGTVLPDAEQEQMKKYIAPAKPGSPASLVGAQIGEEPTSNVYQGVTYPTVADAKAAWGRAGQTIASQGKAAPEIAAQLGAIPTGTQYRGRTFATPEAARAQWGRDYQQIKTQEAMAIAGARGQAMGYYRIYNGLDQDGNVRPMWAGQAVAQGVAPAALGTQIMTKDAQFNDIQFASQQLRNALNNLDAKFSPSQVALLTEAMNERDPTIKQNEISALVSQNLTQAQRDFVVWAPQLAERSMSIRSLAGMGQGAQDLRGAVLATLPSVRDGDRALALQKLDAFDNLTSNLRAGVPHRKGVPTGGGAGGASTTTPPPAGATPRKGPPVLNP